jgi:hypothetical protein
MVGVVEIKLESAGFLFNAPFVCMWREKMFSWFVFVHVVHRVTQTLQA